MSYYSFDCDNVSFFFERYMNSNNVQLKIPECCVVKDTSQFIKCDNEGYITDM